MEKRVRKLRRWSKEVGVFKQRRTNDGKQENGVGTRVAGIGIAVQMQFMFYDKTNENTWDEF